MLIHLGVQSIGVHSSRGLGERSVNKIFYVLTHAPIQITLATRLQKLLLGKVLLRVEPQRPLDEGNEWVVCHLTESVDSW